MTGKTFLVLLVVLLTAGLIVVNSSQPQSPSKSDPRELACFAGQMAVKQKLSDPSAATFLSCSGGAGVTIADNGSRYLARSMFETPDASGIKRQHGYAVSIEITDGNYKTYILHID